MGQKYEHLSLEERCTIACLQAEGRSVRQIATAMDRQPSTVSRELKRNCGSQTYKPAYAGEIAQSRRWTGCKLERLPELRATVLNALRNHLSPEQVAGRLALEAKGHVISHETIYRFIYAQITRHNDFTWRLYLPRAKAKRGWRGRKGASSVKTIQNRVSIEQRPSYVENRSNPGHWEADLMQFTKSQHNVLALHDRKSRLLFAQRPINKTAILIANLLSGIMALVPQPMRKTITFDNGTEFSRHHKLHNLHLKTYFCDTHSPWQKGGIENAIGRLRRFLPRKTDLATISDDQFNALVAVYNNTPRKCLDYQTPAEVYLKQLLHFKCESTPLPSQG